MSRSDEVGAATEARFLSVLSERTERTPDWFVAIKKTSPEWDARAVDFFLYFTPTDHGRVVKVPVQVKTSGVGVARFEERQSYARRSNILLLVVRKEAPDDDIRRMTYVALDKLRRRGARFETFLADQIQQKLSPRAQRRVNSDKRKREKGKRARH